MTSSYTAKSPSPKIAHQSSYTPIPFIVESPNVHYTDDEIISDYHYETTRVEKKADRMVLRPVKSDIVFKTSRKVPKLGMMMIGWGGNNGTTLTAGLIANKLGLTWNTRTGEKSANFYGSVTQCGVVRLGATAEGEEINVPIKELLPMVDPRELAVSGWDISAMDMANALRRAQVLDYDLQKQVMPHMAGMVPLPSIYIPDYIASNQLDRADNVLKGTKQEMMEVIRKNIRDFKAANHLDKVVVLWTATTERYSELRKGLNDTADNLLAAIAKNEAEIAPSTLFACATILEGCCYINGSPQNTLVPGVHQLAARQGVYIAGDDFKTGQTKIKSVLADYLVGAGLKVTSIVSYNHLGNNDGRNLSSPAQFRSKEISKRGVVDDVVDANHVLYEPGEHPDHVIVIKYVPAVGDSKRALDEYTSEIFLGGLNTIAMHNTCEDSLLAGPVMMDLVLIMELMTRIHYKAAGMAKFESFDPVCSILSYLLKAPEVPEGTPVVNALFRQRECLENIFRACIGLAPTNNMLLEYKARKMELKP